MVATPWGRSESLRDRRLPPGPGSSRQAVAENQRERLLGAMVASVAARGYAATRLSDLVEISGVSSKSFYALFPDKETCFVTTVEELIGLFSQQERVVDLATSIAAQPAAARVCLIEGYAAGPAVRQRLREGVGEFEARVRRSLSKSQRSLPAEATTAYVGAFLELSRRQLLGGAIADLPRLFAEVEEQLLPAYQPPPEPLRLATRRPPPLMEAADAPDHPQRIMRALTRVVAEDGYANTTIDRIVAEAGISASIFYSHFAGKEEAALAAIETAAAELLATVLPAFRRDPEWPVAMRAALGSLFSFLTSHPALARLLFVESYAVGPGALARREEVLRPLEVLWAEGRRRVPGIHPNAVDAITGAIFHLIFKRLEGSESSALHGLAPIATYLALVPFLGAEEACEAANGRGRRQQPQAHDPEAVRASAEQPLGRAILNMLTEEALSLAELASRIEQPQSVLSHHLAAMERGALIELAPADPDGVARYRTNMGELHTEEWARMTPSERALVTSQILGLVEADLDRARQSGTLDARVERVLVRLPKTVDQQGWQELSDLHTQMLAAASEIAARSKVRLEESGEQGMSVRNVQMLFEVPSSEPEDETGPPAA